MAKSVKCLCGCGQESKVAKKTVSSRGIIKGQPTGWVNGGHKTRYLAAQKRKAQESLWATEIPLLCACGCGERVTRIKISCPSRGKIKGAWNKYAPGHNRIGKTEKRLNNEEATGCCIQKTGGYCLVYDKEHPRVKESVRGRMIPETLLVVEAKMGKYLKRDAKIWHFDRNVLGVKNLVVCENYSYMSLLIQRRKAYEACGNPSYRKCPVCGGYDDPDKMLKNGRGYRHRQRNNKCSLA